MFDEGQKLPHAYHRTKYESERVVREGLEAKTLVFRPGHRRRPLGDRRDGQDRRSLLLLQAAPAAAPRAARVVPARRARRAARRTSCRSTSSPRRWTTSRTCRTTSCRGDTFHLVDPEPMTVGEALNEFAKAAHAPQFAMRIDQNMTNVVPKPVRAGLHGAADRQAHPRAALPRPRHPAGGDGEPRLPLQVRRPRHPARAQRHRHRRAAAVDLRAAAVGLLGAQPRPGPVPRALARQRDQGQEDPDHRRLERDRARDRPARSARPAARCCSSRARARSSRRSRARSRSAGGIGARASRRPLRPRGHRPAGRRRCSRSTAGSTC